ncbi:Small conductance calcium-activated potassium channel protein [Diplonema papillatum]|nr:Small conductance calcium-activated potassium channel protein [Diplonema papillatum]
MSDPFDLDETAEQMNGSGNHLSVNYERRAESSVSKETKKEVAEKKEDAKELAAALYLPVSTNVRKRKSKKKKKKPAQVLFCDYDTVVKPLQRDWTYMGRRRFVSTVCAAAAVAQICLLCVQMIGVLVTDANYLVDHGEPRANSKYTAVVIAQTVMVVIQIVTRTRWYALRIKNIAYFDHLWRDTPLCFSHLRWVCIAEILVLAIHEPPGFVYFWNDSYKLQLGALLRFYLLFGLLRGWSANVSQGGRMIASIARVSNNKLFQLRAWMYLYPIRFICLVTVSGWLILSIAMYIAEEGALSLDDSMWLTFITMTTVGYGDLSPVTQAGRTVACLTALHGLITSALLINGISNLLQLSSQQGKVVQFLTEARMSGELSTIAVIIVQKSFRHSQARTRGEADLQRFYELKHLCSQFRRLKRQREKFINSMQTNIDVPNTVQRIEVQLIEIKKHLLVPPPPPECPLSASRSTGSPFPVVPPQEQVNLSETMSKVYMAIGDVGAKQQSLSMRQDEVESRLGDIMAALARLEQKNNAPVPST